MWGVLIVEEVVEIITIAHNVMDLVSLFRL
jgi:hypothetical protein